MKTISKTPLDSWTGSKIRLEPGRTLTRKTLEAYQVKMLAQTIAYVREHSPFYRDFFSEMPKAPLSSLEELSAYPFTYPEDIKQDSMAFLCVSQDRVARAVTIESTGTTGRPKRLFFTDSDLELTVDFFHHGMSTLVSPGQKVLILMPGATLGSVGHLLKKGLARMDVEGVVHGPVRQEEDAVQDIIDQKIDTIVGIPVQVLGLARHEKSRTIPQGQIKSILLSTDYVPKAVVDTIENAWKCRVFQHYGMTEMGLGGAVECHAFCGYHPREADLLFEIVDPDTGQPLPEGEQGEVVFTTLTRTGMPLIRYRTGDIASFIPGPCPCGSILKRLSPVVGRKETAVHIGKKDLLLISDLDEIIFSIPNVKDYLAQVLRSDPDDRPAADQPATEQLKTDRLSITLDNGSEYSIDTLIRLKEKISQIPAVKKAVKDRALAIDAIQTGELKNNSNGVKKRTILTRPAKGDHHERDYNECLQPFG